MRILRRQIKDFLSQSKETLMLKLHLIKLHREMEEFKYDNSDMSQLPLFKDSIDCSPLIDFWGVKFNTHFYVRGNIVHLMEWEVSKNGIRRSKTKHTYSCNLWIKSKFSDSKISLRSGEYHIFDEFSSEDAMLNAVTHLTTSFRSSCERCLKGKERRKAEWVE